MYGEKIRVIRELRGFSQEHMASELGIAQNTYSKIETNSSKLTAEMLQKVAEVLGVSPVDILSNQPTIVNFEPNQGTQGIAHIENFYSYQREFVEKMVASKDSEIAHLKEIIDSLIKDKERLMDLLKKST
jgi:transcriptional regulator with XRE-family HTH domain